MLVSVRPATIDDGAIMLLWRNDPEVRSMSRDSRIVASADHRRWLQGALSDPNRVVLIAECVDGRACGMVRFDRIKPEAWEISIIVAPEWRGQGVGTRAVSEGLSYLRSRQGNARVTAAIKLSNAHSRTLFEKLEFRRTGADGNFERFELPAS